MSPFIFFIKGKLPDVTIEKNNFVLTCRNFNLKMICLQRPVGASNFSGDTCILLPYFQVLLNTTESNFLCPQLDLYKHALGY